VAPEEAPLGRYELPRQSGEAHLYRTGHPLAQALVQQAQNRKLPLAKLRFDYAARGIKLSTLEPLRGRRGWLAMSILTIEAMGQAEDTVLVAATLADGVSLHSEDAHKLLRLPAQVLDATTPMEPPASLDEDILAQERQQVELTNQRNLGYFEAEVQKLDAWAEDLKNSLEHDVKELDREIKDVRRTASMAATLDEKLHWQKRQRELEDKRNQLRRKIFDRQDDIDAQRNRLIEELEGRLSRHQSLKDIFIIQWELV
jgi:hypothetical protein